MVNSTVHRIELFLLALREGNKMFSDIKIIVKLHLGLRETLSSSRILSYVTGIVGSGRITVVSISI